MTAIRMKAYTYIEKGRFELLDKPKPKLLDPKDAIVRVTLSSICSSDLHIKHGSVPRAVPGNYNKYKQTGDLNELEQYNNFSYPRLSAQIIDGHSIDGSVPEQLEAAVVVADRKLNYEKDTNNYKRIIYVFLYVQGVYKSNYY